MKVQKRRNRLLRRLALAACLAALAVPTAASAQPQLPGWQNGVGSSATTDKPYTLPASFKPEVTTPASPNSTPVVAAPAIVREVRTVTDNSERTLALVLASVALGIALCSTAYAAVRFQRIQRRVPGSSSRPLLG
jgi:hypothetical protein